MRSASTVSHAPRSDSYARRARNLRGHVLVILITFFIGITTTEAFSQLPSEFSPPQYSLFGSGSSASDRSNLQTTESSSESSDVDSEQTPKPPLRKRRTAILQWSNDKAVSWQGEVRFENAQLIAWKCLGTNRDELECFHRKGQSIRVLPGLKRKHDAVQIELLCEPTASILVMLGTGNAEEKSRVNRITLTDTSKEQQLTAPGLGELHCSVTTKAFEVRYDRANLVFSPHESFEVNMTPTSQPESVNSMLLSKMKLARVGTDEPLIEQSQDAMLDALGQFNGFKPYRLKLPAEEGEYEIRFELWAKVTKTPLGGNTLVDSQTLRTVVIDPRKPSAPQALISNQVMNGFPSASPDEWRLLQNHRMSEIPLVQWVQEEASQKLDRRMLKLESLQPGFPYVIDVAMAGPQTKQYRVQVYRDSPEAGSLLPLIDTTIAVEGTFERPKTQQLVYWAETPTAWIIFEELMAGSSKSETVVSIFGGAGQLPSTPRMSSPKRRESYPHIGSLRDFELPSPSGDSETYNDPTLKLTQRITSQLHFAGLDGAMITVADARGSCYPSQLTPASLSQTQLDSATLERIGQGTELSTNDQLEQIMRVFDREDLKLVPLLHLEYPLRSLTDQNVSPPYRLSDTKVEAAILALIEEIQERYGHHASLKGIGVLVSQKLIATSNADAENNPTPSLTKELDGFFKKPLPNGRRTEAQREFWSSIADTANRSWGLPKLFVFEEPIPRTNAEAPHAWFAHDYDDGINAPLVWCRSLPLDREDSLAKSSPAELLGDTRSMQWRTLTKHLAESDPTHVIWSLPGLRTAQWQPLAEFSQQWQTLPLKRAESLRELASINSNLHRDASMDVRVVKDTGGLFGYVTNSSPWPAMVQAKFRNSDHRDLEVLIDGQWLPQPVDAGIPMNISCDPHSLRAFRIVGGSPGIESWSSLRSKQDELQVKKWLALFERAFRATETRQLRNYPAVQNARFTQQAERNAIPGWDIIPSDAITHKLVSRSSEDSAPLLEIDASAPEAWKKPSIATIQTTSFPVPPTGRLSVRCRVGLDQNVLPAQVNVRLISDPANAIFEANLQPMQGTDFHDAASVRWYETDQEIISLAGRQTKNLKLQFVFTGNGRIWIDGVSIHDQFLTRNELQSLWKRYNTTMQQTLSHDYSAVWSFMNDPLAQSLTLGYGATNPIPADSLLSRYHFLLGAPFTLNSALPLHFVSTNQRTPTSTPFTSQPLGQSPRSASTATMPSSHPSLTREGISELKLPFTIVDQMWDEGSNIPSSVPKVASQPLSSTPEKQPIKQNGLGEAKGPNSSVFDYLKRR